MYIKDTLLLFILIFFKGCESREAVYLKFQVMARHPKPGKVRLKLSFISNIDKSKDRNKLSATTIPGGGVLITMRLHGSVSPEHSNLKNQFKSNENSDFNY